MIIGFGSDLCNITRIEKALAQFGDRFVQRCFTTTERRRSDARAGRAASYAKRFAAKEACAKALGTGLRRGVFWRDMGVAKPADGTADDGVDRGRGQTSRRDHAGRDMSPESL